MLPETSVPTERISAAVWFDTWIVIYENKTIGREWVTNWVKDKTSIYGTFLSVTTIVINIVVALLVIWSQLQQRRRRRQRSLFAAATTQIEDSLVDSTLPADAPSSVATPSLPVNIDPASSLSPPPAANRRVAGTLNFTVVQTLIGSVVVPISIVIDYNGRWTFGPEACRVWLLVQILLLAASSWILVLVTYDQLALLVAPLTQAKFAGWKTSTACVIGSWFLAAFSLFPLALSILHHGGGPGEGGGPGGGSAPQDGHVVTSDVIVEEICAVTLTPDDAVALSLAAFLFPAALTAVGSAAILYALRRRLRDDKKSADEAKQAEEAPERHLKMGAAVANGMETRDRDEKFAGKEEQKTSDITRSLDPMDKKQEQISTPNRMSSTHKNNPKMAKDEKCGFLPAVLTGSHAELGNGLNALLAVNACCLITWSPFFFAYLLIPFCQDLCVDPSVWSAFIWIGYTNATLAPLFWFIDEGLRRAARDVVRGVLGHGRRCWGKGYGKNGVREGEGEGVVQERGCGLYGGCASTGGCGSEMSFDQKLLETGRGREEGEKGREWGEGSGGSGNEGSKLSKMIDNGMLA